ncbi:MAG: hypothetical protein NWF14_03540 [Candidatus Bathyarchaeota archaeon]|nr:hypothetical protein [Candidatus Bathyarchaeota archaeon]
MPLTPFHFGPGLLVGLLLLSFIDFPTFLIASVIVDIEPILVLALSLGYPLHRFFHSFLGGTLAALILVVAMTKIRDQFSPLLSVFKLEQKTSFKGIALASFSGVYIHVLLDSQMHADMQPFYPLDFNPFLSSGSLPGLGVTMACVWCFFGAVAVYAFMLFMVWRQRKVAHE